MPLNPRICFETNLPIPDNSLCKCVQNLDSVKHCTVCNHPFCKMCTRKDSRMTQCVICEEANIFFCGLDCMETAQGAYAYIERPRICPRCISTKFSYYFDKYAVLKCIRCGIQNISTYGDPWQFMHAKYMERRSRSYLCTMCI